MAILGQTEGPSSSACLQPDRRCLGREEGNAVIAGAQNILPASKYLQILMVFDALLFHEQVQGHPEPLLQYMQ